MEVFAVWCGRGSAAYWKSLQIPVISAAHLATPMRPQESLVGKALSATRGLATRGLGTRQGLETTVYRLLARWHCPCTWVKPGRFGSFFVLCFLGGHCLQMLCLPGFGTHASAQNLPHFRAFPASIREHSPPKCLFFMANAKLPNRPGFALLRVAHQTTSVIVICVDVG